VVKKLRSRDSFFRVIFYSGFSDKLKTAALRAAPTDGLRPTDNAFVFSSVGLNPSVGDKKLEFFLSFSA
jgi:hypothetical protein